jgi:PAS domain S-box-containing protein
MAPHRAIRGAAVILVSSRIGAWATSRLFGRLHRAEAAERRAVEQLAHAERLAQLGSACRDLRTGCSRWSDGFHAILGLVPGSCEPSQTLFLSLVHPADRAMVARSLTEVLQSGETGTCEFRVVRPDGDVRMVSGQAERILDANGRAFRLDSTLQDITERRHLENELDGLIRELWRSNEELEQFAYVASHDLRQPLRVVGSYVTLIEEDLAGKLPDDTTEYMAFVRDGVRRMDRLITDLLAYSRVGRMADDHPVSVAATLEAVVTDLSFEIAECGAAITIADDLPTVMGDTGEMERLFQNLLGNALKYRSPDRHPVVRIWCEAATDWVIRIADNGIGIPPEHAERVFGIFQRLHPRESYEGTGVGLAIARKIVERHGGSIRIEPSSEGTLIAIRWPKLTNLD